MQGSAQKAMRERNAARRHDPSLSFTVPGDPPIEVKHLAGCWWLVNGAEVHSFCGDLSAHDARILVEAGEQLRRERGLPPEVAIVREDFVLADSEIACHHLGGRFWQVNGYEVEVRGGDLSPALARQIWTDIQKLLETGHETE